MTEQTEAPARDFEVEAKEQGWVPQEDFRGSKEAWIPAEDFVHRGEQINPILRKSNERFKVELAATKAEMAELRVATEEFKKFQKDSFDKKKEFLEDEIKELREQKKKALTEGDGDLAVDLDDRLDRLKDEKVALAVVKPIAVKPPPALTPEMQVEISDWISKNDWYKSNVRMAAATNAIAEDLRKEKPHLTGKAFFEELDIVLEENFTPERIGRKTKAKSMVEGASSTSRRPASSDKRSYENLPADAKAACDKFVKSKLMTREAYVAEYDFS